MDISAIIIHFGKAEYTSHVLECLLSVRDTELECIVVDNASSSSPAAALREAPRTRVLRIEHSRGYGAACNAGAALARGRYILILNNDLDIPAGSVEALRETMDAHPEVGVLGPMLRFPDGRFQLSWGDDPDLGSEFRERGRQRRSRAGGIVLDRERATTAMRDADWITGAVMLIRREAWEAVGGFDESFYFYFEDVDLCRRVRTAGYKVACQPASAMVHFGGGSDPQANPEIVRAYRREQLRYYARYNSFAQFSALKVYLIAKFSIAAVRGTMLLSDVRQLLKQIAIFSRTSERQHARRQDV
ncbi:MAG: glycosyltransferase [Bacteroidia bacterium]|nr:glycosyltransferase [Bacteroidia bacterium]